MLGGSPEKGKEIFLKAMKQYPHNHLIRMSYLQYYIIPKGDEAAFDEQMRLLEKEYNVFKSAKEWSPSASPVESQNAPNPRLNLFNATAFKRFELYQANRDDVF